MLVIAAAITVQGGSGLAAQLLQRHGALFVVAMRVGFGAAMLLVLRPPRRGVAAGAWRLAIALGLVMAAMNTLFYLSIERIPLGVAVTFEFWGPLAVAVFGSRRLRDFAWVVLAALGIYLLAGARLTADDLAGVAAAIGAGGCWALFILIGSRLARVWSDGRAITASMTAGALVLVPAAVLTGAADVVLAEPTIVLSGLLLAALSSAIPYTLELAAMRRISSAAYGVLMSLEPAVAAVVGFVLLAQVLTGADLVGITLVVLASAGASWSARRATVVPGELEAA